MQCLKNYQVPLSEIKIICRSQGISFIESLWEKKRQFGFLSPKKSSAISLRFCYVSVKSTNDKYLSVKTTYRTNSH